VAEKKQNPGGLTVVLIVIFAVVCNLIPMLTDDKVKTNDDVISEEIITDNFIYKDYVYKIKSDNSTDKIKKAVYNWEFITTKFSKKGINLEIEILNKEVSEAMKVLSDLYKIPQKDLGVTYDFNQHPIAASIQFWRSVYKILHNSAGYRVDRITDSFKKIAVNEKLDSNDLLLLVITFIQNIEYQIPDEKYGVLPPIVSVAREYGDCDTTAILLLTILKRLGYDSLIYYSYEYRHAMLGIFSNSTGIYKSIGGKKYYFLETTSPGWSIGQISPKWDDVDKWQALQLY